MEVDPGAYEHDMAGNCLRIRMLNDDLLNRMEPTILEFKALVERHEARILRLDVRGAPTPATFNERFALGQLAALHLSALPIGVLSRPEQADPGRIAQVVANNRGAQIAVFTDESELDEWIRSHPATRPGPT